MKKSEYEQNMMQSFIDSLDKAEDGNWVKPWIGAGKGLHWPKNAVTGKEYTGSNVFGLMIDGYHSACPTGDWATYKQWKLSGNPVRKGEKSTSRVVFYNTGVDEDTDKKFAYVKITPVFNYSQTVNYEEPEQQTADTEIDWQSIADEYIINLESDIDFEGTSAYYTPVSDKICMPKAGLFIDTKDATATQNFYSTLLHEHIHWTGHPSRLDRLQEIHIKEKYAYEELIAELGSVLLSVRLGLEPEPTRDHAKYINHWKQIVTDSPKALLKAMAEAQKAVSYCDQLQQTAIAAE